MQYIKGHYGIVAGIICVLLVVLGYIIFTKLDNQRAAEQAANQAFQALGGTKQDTAPYTDIAGNPVALNDYLGSVIVVNSWASWSPDSRTELPLLAEIANEFEDVHIVAINRAEPATTAERFLKTIGTYDQVQLVLDPTDRYYAVINGYAMPETVVYNADGDITFRKHGPVTKAELEDALYKVIDK